MARSQCGGGPDQCLGTQSFTVSPAPVNGHYNGGQVVTFCYTIEDYNQCSSNWLQTIDLDLGAGWDASTVTPVSTPLSCDGVGNWDYYLSSTSIMTGLTFGPCFAYDSPAGSPMGVLDGNPGNNFGDNCTTNIWTFCFSVQVNYGCNNQSLNVDVTAIGDGTGGAWTNNICPGVAFNICGATCESCHLQVSNSVINPSCADNDGSITLYADSAFGLVSYLWQPGLQTTQSISSLSSGTYIGIVTDSIGCEISDTIILNYINPVQLAVAKSNAQCFGYCNGSIYLSPSGGTMPYSYDWSNGVTTSADTALCEGTYFISVTDSNLCSVKDTIYISQPAKIVLSVSHTDASCFGGSNGAATVDVSGGSGIYFYHWQPSNQLTETAIGLAPISYNIHVTDTKGCFADTTITIGSPPQIQSNPVIADESCFGFSNGSIVTNVTSGVPPYNYDWINSNGSGISALNLFAGTYWLKITDANGCTELDSFMVSEPDPLSGNFEITPASCPGASDGSITMIPSGGTSPYSYEWNNNIVNNTAGLYDQEGEMNTVTITDANNCVTTISGVIPILPDFIADVGRDTSIELGTFALLKASVNRGGIFSFDWSSGYHLIDSNAESTLANPYVTTTYTVLITELSSGCKDDDSVTVFILPTDYLLFPTAFTPNGDGLNDVFLPISGNLVNMQTFKVFNRWGNMVFSNKSEGWDGSYNGKSEETGAYIYEVTYKIEGRSELYSKKGSVTLLR